MVITFPAIVTVASAGGLAGGFCWGTAAVMLTDGERECDEQEEKTSGHVEPPRRPARGRRVNGVYLFTARMRETN